MLSQKDDKRESMTVIIDGKEYDLTGDFQQVVGRLISSSGTRRKSGISVIFLSIGAKNFSAKGFVNFSAFCIWLIDQNICKIFSVFEPVHKAIFFKSSHFVLCKHRIDAKFFGYFFHLFVTKVMPNDYFTLSFGKIGYLTSENAIAFAVSISILSFYFFFLYPQSQ